MEIKLKKRLLQNHTLPVTRETGKIYRRITGMTSANIAGPSADPIGYERSGVHLAHVAEIELKRAQALAEAYRLSLR